MEPSWIGFAAAQATVSCGGATHRLRWEAGTLSALDHDDAEGERTLAALGGQRCACIDVLDAWARRARDPRVLVLASRGVTDPLAPAEQPMGAPSGLRPPGARLAGTRAGGWTSHARVTGFRAPPLSAAAPGQPPPDPDADLLSVLELGGALPERLVASVAQTWRTRLEQPTAQTRRVRPQLEAALYGRATAAVRTWLGQPDLALGLTMVGARRPRLLAAGAGGVRAELPFAWLAEVWCRGLATVWGRFCLAATTADGLRWTLDTIGPDLGAVQTMTIDLPPAAVTA